MSNKIRTNIISVILLALTLILAVDGVNTNNELTRKFREYQNIKTSNIKTNKELEQLMTVPNQSDRAPVELITKVAKGAYSWHNQQEYLASRKKISTILDNPNILDNLMPNDEDTAGQSMIDNLNLSSKVTNLFIYKLPDNNNSNKREYGVLITYLATTPTSVNAISKSNLSRTTEYKFEIDGSNKKVSNMERLGRFREVLNKGKVN